MLELEINYNIRPMVGLCGLMIILMHLDFVPQLGSVDSTQKPRLPIFNTTHNVRPPLFHFQPTVLAKAHLGLYLVWSLWLIGLFYKPGVE